MVRSEDLLSDVFKKVIAIVHWNVFDLLLEPGIHQLEIAEVVCSHFVGDDVEESALRLRIPHPAAGRPDCRCRGPAVTGILPRVNGEGIGEEGVDLACASVGRFAAFSAKESENSLQDRL